MAQIEYLVYFFVFLLGTAVGSFLNVLVLRLDTGIGLQGRSFCFTCGKKLAWFELIPVLSFLVQKGRCRGCTATISWQYPLVELVSGILFVLIFGKFDLDFSLGNILYTTYYILIFSLLLAISVYDIRHKIIPNLLVYLFIVFSLAHTFGVLDFSHLNFIRNWKLEIGNLLSGPALAAPFAALWLISKGRWIGFGDAKLALGIGWLLGLSGGIAAMLISVWTGALVGVLSIIIGKVFPLLTKGRYYTMKSEIPFGPFLVLGTLCVFLLGLDAHSVLEWFTFWGAPY